MVYSIAAGTLRISIKTTPFLSPLPLIGDEYAAFGSTPWRCAGDEHPNRSIILSLFGGGSWRGSFLDWFSSLKYTIGFRLKDLDLSINLWCVLGLPPWFWGQISTYQGFLLELVEIIPNVMNRWCIKVKIQALCLYFWKPTCPQLETLPPNAQLAPNSFPLFLVAERIRIRAREPRFPH